VSPSLPKLFPEPRVIALAPGAGGVGALAANDLPKGRVTVVLSNHFVRYALVPWSTALSGATEEMAYVRHHFVRIYGERAKAWSFRASPAPSGRPRLCSAVDTALLDEIKRAFAKSKAKLVSIQPRLMATFNRWRGAVPAAGAWLVMVEQDRACIGLHAGGNWQAVQNARGEWPALLERERHRIGGELPELVLLHGAPAAAAQAPGWKLRELAA
jgi:hypothetical protein